MSQSLLQVFSWTCTFKWIARFAQISKYGIIFNSITLFIGSVLASSDGVIFQNFPFSAGLGPNYHILGIWGQKHFLGYIFAENHLESSLEACKLAMGTFIATILPIFGSWVQNLAEIGWSKRLVFCKHIQYKIEITSFDYCIMLLLRYLIL